METERLASSSGRLSPGQRLRELREAKGLTLEAASEATHVRVRYLDALEHEDVESLLAAAYAKSFLKAYARHLEADEALIDEYRELINDRWHTERTTTEEEPTPRVGGRLVFWGAFGIAAVVVVVVVAFSDGAPGGQTMPDRSTRGADVSMASDTTTYDSVPRHVTRPLVPATLTLEIVAVETTWVEIVTDGKTRRSETLSPGEIRLLGAENDFTVTLGNAGGVELRLNGSDLPALGPRGAVVRDAVITKEILEKGP